MLIYSLSSFGIGVNQFYCCGKLKSTSITYTQGSKEKCGNENSKSDCCRNKYQFFKVKDNHVAADTISNPVKHFSNLHLFTPSFEVMPLANEPTDIANASHAPPILHCISVYILNCNFRI